MAEYIERETALDIFGEGPSWTGYFEPYPLEVHLAVVGVARLIREEIEKIPAADVAPVAHGRWIEQEDPCGDPYYTCSACKDDFYIEMTGAVEKDLFLYSYCPNCGAKMDGGAEG